MLRRFILLALCLMILPVALSAKSIGTYNKGCQTDAIKLKPQNNLNLIYKNTRKTQFAQNDLVQLLQVMAKKMETLQLGILQVGNLSMKNGGPLYPYSSSHHIGLDADVAYVVSPKTKLRTGFVSVLDKSKKQILKNHFTQNSLQTLKLFAENDKVERILVHPLIKKEVCESFKKEKWMGKIRPWWKHDDHFHVRLKCPKNSKSCEPQTPPPSQDDCDSEAYHWWFSEEAELMRKGKLKKASGKKTKPKPYPKECQTILGL